MDEYEYDEGSDIDNWETQQVFLDKEYEDDEGPDIDNWETQQVFLDEEGEGEMPDLKSILDNFLEILEKYRR